LKPFKIVCTYTSLDLRQEEMQKKKYKSKAENFLFLRLLFSDRNKTNGLLKYFVFQIWCIL